MLEEESGAMEKKLPSRQSPVQHKNNGSICEKKTDFISNKNGRQRKQREPNNACRPQELPQLSRPVQRPNSRYFNDKRPRQRDCINDRQGEEIAEAGEIFDVSNTFSRKGNANHLLKFSYISHEQNGNYGGWRGGTGRSNSGRGQGFYRRTPVARYSKEQFLQASCQFVVRNDSEYTVQAIDPDALVNWDKVELVRTFSTEAITCPICLQVPCAGKITKCGHTYCWPCILHHLNDTDSAGHNKCPVCPHTISSSELKSVQCIEVPEYKVGDEIEMRLMRKSKGSVYTSPKCEWKDRCGLPHNIDDGDITNYMKILIASESQVQQVINKEKEALDAHLLTAEDYETCFIEMAKIMLQEREKNIKAPCQSTVVKEETQIPQNNNEITLNSSEKSNLPAKKETRPTVKYLDAFENKEQLTIADDTVTDTESSTTAVGTVAKEAEESSDIETKLLSSREDQGMMALSPEEVADELELPEANSECLNQRSNNTIQNKDTYYFYQASTGQQIYLNSLNAQCLIKEYGSLENGPEVIKATIVAIERIFMTEDIRKRLRYLNHIPLTCEFHVVELKLLPPVLSKDTLRHFHPEFDKRRRARQRKQKEEKIRAKQHEVEHKKSFGIYPEVQIPLDNLTQFPSHLSTSLTSSESLVPDESLSTVQGIKAVPGDVWGNRSRTDSEGSHSGAGAMSFATMLKEGKSLPQTSPWSRGKPQSTSDVPPSPSRCEPRPPATLDDDDGGEFLPAPPISSSWFDDISKAMDAASKQNSADTCASSKVNGKKKKKKQLLFSTAMARKN